jgi:hypothetical protein
MNREINFELIPAIYGPEGYEFNQVDFPDKYEKLKNDSVYCEGFILAEVFEHNGRKLTRFVLNGSDEQQKEMERLKAFSQQIILLEVNEKNRKNDIVRD